MHKSSLYLTPTLPFEPKFGMFIINGYYTKSKRLKSLDSLFFLFCHSFGLLDVAPDLQYMFLINNTENVQLKQKFRFLQLLLFEFSLSHSFRGNVSIFFIGFSKYSSKLKSLKNINLNFCSYPVDTRHCFNVYNTSSLYDFSM